MENETSCFVPDELRRAAERYAESQLAGRQLGGSRRRKVGGIRYLSSEFPANEDSVIVEITEEPVQAGGMRHVYRVPLSEIAS
jgi:hypothetical protein